jgi:integral membrane sensor domain MASE1
MNGMKILRIILFAIVYGILAFASIGLRDAASHSVLLWPAGGILLGALMISPQRDWVWWLAVAGVVHLLAGLNSGRDLPISLVYVASDLLVMSAVAAFWRSRVREGDHALDIPASLAWFLAAVVLGGVLDAFFSTFALQLLGIAPTAHGWMARFMPGVIGCLIGAPFVVAWSDFRAKRSGGPSGQNFYLGLCWFVLMIVTATVAFDGPVAIAVLGDMGYELAYLPILFVVLVALVWGQRGLTLALIVLAMIAAVNTVQGEGPFASAHTFFGDALLEVQGYIGAAALVGLLMAAIIATRNQALRDAAAWKVRFEAALMGSRQLMYEYDPVTGLFSWGGSVHALMGIPPEQLGTLAAFLERIHPADRERIAAAFAARSAGKAARLEQQDLRYRILCEPDSWQNVIDTGAPIVDLDDEVYRVNGFLRLQGAAGEQAEQG